MLVVVSVTLCLVVLAAFASAKVVRLGMERLGLDLMDVMLWLGLAEFPSEAKPPRAGRVEEAVSQPAPQRRRRSPHRSLGRRTRRRPPAQSSV